MPDGKTGWVRVAEWYAAALFVFYAALIFAHAGGPSLTDYANWTYQGVLLREHLLGHSDAAHRLKFYPVPNSLTTIGIGMFALALPWLLAAKTWLAMQLALCFASMRLLLRTIAAPAIAWVVIPQAVFLNVNFWYGFMNFELGVAWVMLFAALLLRRAAPPALALALLLTFITHMIPFCACTLLLVLHCRQTGTWRKMWVASPAIALTAWYTVGRYLLAGNADGQAGMQETVRTYSAAFWAFKLNSYAKSFGFVNPMGLAEDRFGRAGCLLLLLSEVTLATLVLVGLVRAAKQGTAPYRFVWTALGVLAPVFLLAPSAALGISDPGARVLQAGLSLAVAFCWFRVEKRARVLAGCCTGFLTAAGLILFMSYGGSSGTMVRPHSGDDQRLARFARVPNRDQDYFYQALEDERKDLPVFPTGILLNR